MNNLEILRLIESQIKTHPTTIALPSDIKLTEDELKNIITLAQLQFPSIPLDILKSLSHHSESYTYKI